MLLSDIIVEAKEVLAPVYGSEEVLAILRLWLSDRTSQEYNVFSLEKDFEIAAELGEQLHLELNELSSGRPLQYVLGYTWFNDLKVSVSEAVLIPRPETEELVQMIYEQNEDFSSGKILDICSGSGCIALALKSKFADAQVYAADVSLEALAIARENSETLQLPVEYCWCDVLENNWGVLEDEQFDIIVSNPPYIMLSESGTMHDNVLKFEPSIALFVEDDDPLVFYRSIAAFACSHLNLGGQLWLEINSRQADPVSRLLQALQFSEVFIYKDLSGNDRFVSGILPE